MAEVLVRLVLDLAALEGWQAELAWVTW